VKKFGIQSSHKHKLPENLHKVDEINNFFLSSQSQEPANHNVLSFYSNSVHENVSEFFTFNKVSETDILKIVTSISSSAVGSDGISVKMLKFCLPHLLPILRHIFNFCIHNSVFPTLWKEASIIPIPKRPSPSELSDLRPISILPVLARILEKILASQLLNHINKFNILPQTQSGFRRGYGCATALINITDDVLRNTNDGRLTALVLLDYSKAFDTINHEVLLSILRYIGLGVSAVSLFTNYLSERRQKVVLCGKASLSSVVCSGVPQGSILGPMLFTIYTSQFQSVIKNSTIHMYADDTQIYHSFSENNFENSIQELNDDISSMVGISEEHGLLINPQKSSVILFGNRAVRDSIKGRIKIRVKDDNLSFVDCIKDLGVYLDSDLRFKQHITKNLQLAYCSLKMLYSNRHILCQQLRLHLCDLLVLSRLNYCDTLYHSCIDSSERRRIQVLQNSCLRFSYSLRARERVTSFRERSGWLCMRDRRCLHVASFYHRVISEGAPLYLFNKVAFRSDVHNINTRFRSALDIPVHRLEIFKRSFTYCIASVYNNIPWSLKTLSISSFKRRLKEMIGNNLVKL